MVCDVFRVFVVVAGIVCKTVPVFRFDAWAIGHHLVGEEMDLYLYFLISFTIRFSNSLIAFAR